MSIFSQLRCSKHVERIHASCVYLGERPDRHLPVVAEGPASGCEFPVETQRELAAVAWARLIPAQRDWCHRVSREVRRCRDPAATLYGVRLVLESLAPTNAAADE